MKYLLFSIAWLAMAFTPLVSHAAPKPNVILILADDLGYGDLGCYGQKKIKTPNLDRLAADGIRFTQCYAGSTVCAPSRAALMTGKHTGHATVRGNRKVEVPLTADEKTIPEAFHNAGYDTALFGKWGVGGNDTSGAPNRKGFNYFFGYLTQGAAHDYYPEFLWRNTQQYPLPDNADGKKGTYTHDLLMSEALEWLSVKRDEPFFLYLPITIPHANNEASPEGLQVPSAEPYNGENWPQQEKNFAAMITRLDSGVGQTMALLKERGLDEDTLIIFTSDNGPHQEGGHKSDFFNSNGALRGIKRDLYDGGIRVPMLARWPGKIKEGTISEQVWASWDMLPTLTELIDEPLPNDIDGVSMLPALLENKIVPHPPLYWEFYERGFSQAARDGKWKAVKTGVRGPIELYDLSQDPGEEKDLAEVHPELVARFTELFKQAHTDSPFWPVPKETTPPRGTLPSSQSVALTGKSLINARVMEM